MFSSLLLISGYCPSLSLPTKCPTPSSNKKKVSCSGNNTSLYCMWTGASVVAVAVKSEKTKQNQQHVVESQFSLCLSLCFCELIQWLEQQGADRTKTMHSVVQCSRGLHMDPSPAFLFLQRTTDTLYPAQHWHSCQHNVAHKSRLKSFKSGVP